MGTVPDAQEAFVDITDTFDRKIEALLSHVSQLTDPDGIEDRLREWNGANAEAGGLPSGRLAERYVVMPAV
jgi:LmbE family N-acetylglucosaminyl deacetylase